MKIGVILIATRKYKIFLNPLIQSLNTYFDPKIGVEYLLFIDDPTYPVQNPSHRRLSKIPIEAYAYPYATLYRYQLLSSVSSQLCEYDYLVYIDVSMEVVAPMGQDFIFDQGLVAVQHPAFYRGKRGGGTYEVNPKSNAYFKNVRHPYVQGSVQGGRTPFYLQAVKVMSDWIQEDEKNGVMAIWHDESHWNKYINITDIPVRLLEPSYSFSAPFLPRSMKPVILKLDKKHEEMRN